MRCTIQGISHQGEGVGRVDGQVVFIPFALPGEEVEIEIKENRKSYARAVMTEIISASPDRIDPPCPHYFTCGGCAYQHVRYEKEIEYKRQIVIDSLLRIGKIDTEVQPVAAMEDPWGYRNKVTWHIGSDHHGKVLGYYAAGTHRVIPITKCLLLPEKIQRISEFLSGVVKSIGTGRNAAITIRKSSLDDTIMLVFHECSLDKKLLKRLSGMADSIYTASREGFKHLYGLEKLNEKAGEVLFQLSPGAFFQVNPVQAEKLIHLVRKSLEHGDWENLLDAYCGVGTFTLNIADMGQKIIGVEDYPQAIDDAQNNAALNNIKNCEFITGASEKVLPELNTRFDAVVVDPPRAGLKPVVVETLIKTRPLQITYVSCNPATLARDLKGFVEAGYNVHQVKPVDMFPRTSHCEVCCLLTK